MRDLGSAAGLLRRSLKLYARGDGYRARRLLIESLTNIKVPSPSPPVLGEVLDRLADAPRAAPPLPEPVSVIVPIYNGAAHVQRLLGSLLAHTDPRHRIVLADDGSTDPAIGPMLAQARARHPNVQVVRAAANQGFIATINAAMSATTGHVAILNTDTEVPAGWLERLLQPVMTESGIASSAPFSNAAAIFSFPSPNVDHELPPGVTLPEIDAAFGRLTLRAEDLRNAPATMGFCMGINRIAWDRCGGFDEATFGRGFCEETDWCLRAAAAGWRNVLVPNLFVYHLHGGTFQSLERKRLLEANYRVLHRRWPGYYHHLAAFRRRDPWATYRAAAVLVLATSTSVGERLAGEVTLGPPHGDGSRLVTARRASWACQLLARQADLARLRALAPRLDLGVGAAG